MGRKRTGVNGKGKGEPIDPAGAVLAAALAKAKPGPMRDWLAALASDQADRAGSAAVGTSVPKPA